MARLPRLIVDGLPHIVSQRVQHEQTLARDAADRSALLDRLRMAAFEHAVAIHAYALLDDRFDLVVTPGSAAGLSHFMQAVARGHSAAFNRRHGRAGGLWAGRYRVAVIDAASWLLTCMRYVDQQAQRPPTAGDVAAADPAPAVSSQSHHTGANVEAWMHDPAPYWALGNTPFERQATYRALVARPVAEEEVMQIAAALRGGWALGPAGFAQGLEVGSVRPATRRVPGRPRRHLAGR
jgi:putative transposase